MAHITLNIDGTPYIALPEAEYRRLVGKTPSAQEDGVAWARAKLSETLRRARETGGLTQEALAKKLGKSQVTISRAESGGMSVGERYVASVLKACGLPADWSAKPVGIRPVALSDQQRTIRANKHGAPVRRKKAAKRVKVG